MGIFSSAAESGWPCFEEFPKAFDVKVAFGEIEPAESAVCRAGSKEEVNTSRGGLFDIDIDVSVIRAQCHVILSADGIDIDAFEIAHIIEPVFRCLEFGAIERLSRDKQRFPQDDPVLGIDVS